MQIKLAGQRYAIEKRLANGEIQLKHVATETLLPKTETEIVKALFGGAAELLGENGEVETLQSRRQWSNVNDFEALDDADPRKREAIRRLRYIEGVQKARLINFGKCGYKLKPIIQRVSKEIRDGDTPSCVTVIRWVNIYSASGDDPRSLSPAFKARGRAEHHDRRRISGDAQTGRAVDRIIDDVINEHYLQLTRPTAQATYHLIRAHCRRESISRR